MPKFRNYVPPATSTNLDNFVKFMHRCYDELQAYVPFDGDNLFVSGGFFIRKLIGASIRDIDVYVNKPSLKTIITQYTDAGYYVIGSSLYNNNFFVLKNNDNLFTIDLIGFHEPKSLSYVDGFDFNICQIALDENEIYLPTQNSIDDLYDKKLKFTGNCYKKTIKRLAKYLQMGFTVDDASLEMMTRSFLMNTMINNSPIDRFEY